MPDSRLFPHQVLTMSSIAGLYADVSLPLGYKGPSDGGYRLVPSCDVFLLRHLCGDKFVDRNLEAAGPVGSPCSPS